MGSMVTVSNNTDQDIELVSALYRAAGEPDAFNELIAILRARYVLSRDAEYNTRASVLNQLPRIDRFLLPGSSDRWRDELERAVEEVPNAAVVFDTFGNVMVANREGEAVFGTKPGARFEMALIDPSYRGPFREFFTGARARSNRRRIIVRLDTEELARRESSARAMELCEAMVVEDLRRDHPCIALRVLDIPWSAEIGSQLSEAFALTDAESEIAREFYELRDSGLVAKTRGTSLATVRTQLKSIYSKTQTTNQTSLLHLLSLLAARAAMARRSEMAAWSYPTGRDLSFTSRRGRRVHYTWQGAADGRPALMLHGYTMAHILPPAAEKIFCEAGWKVLLPSRPGFGSSEYDQDRETGHESAEALLDLSEQLGIRQVPVLAVSTGIVSLARAVAKRPGLAGPIAMTGHLFSGDVALNPELSFHQRLMLNLMHKAPRVQSTFSRIAYRNMQRVGMDWYIERLIAKGSNDEAYFRSGVNGDLIRAAAAHLFAQGPEVFSRELKVDRSPALGLLRDPRHSLLVLLQAENAVHRFDTYRDYLDLGSHARIEELAGHGDLYFYSAGEHIARAVVEHFAQAI